MKKFTTYYDKREKQQILVPIWYHTKGKKNYNDIPSVAMTAAKMIIPTGCTLNFPIG